MLRRLLVLVSALTLLLPATASANDPESARPAPESINHVRLDTPISSSSVTPPSRLDGSLLGRSGPQAVLVRLKADAVTEAAAKGNSTAAQQWQFGRVKQQQEAVVGHAQQLDANAVVLGTAQRA